MQHAKELEEVNNKKQTARESVHCVVTGLHPTFLLTEMTQFSQESKGNKGLLTFVPGNPGKPGSP